jgi:hypothetical protein
MGVATSTAILGAAAIGAVGAGMQADAAKDAAAMQVAGGDRALAQQLRMFEMGREDQAPYREAGYTALKDIESLKPMFTAQFGPEQFEQYLDPSMEFRRKLGEQTTARMLNVGGGAISGNTLRGLEEFGQGLASTEYGNAFNRFQNQRTNIYNTLANIAGMGQEAVNTGVTAGQNFAGSQSELITGQAAAQAAGGVGAANAYSGALGNAGNMMYLNSLLGNRAPGTAVTNPSPSNFDMYGSSTGFPSSNNQGFSLSPQQVSNFGRPAPA